MNRWLIASSLEKDMSIVESISLNQEKTMKSKKNLIN